MSPKQTPQETLEARWTDLQEAIQALIRENQQLKEALDYLADRGHTLPPWRKCQAEDCQQLFLPQRTDATYCSKRCYARYYQRERRSKP